MATIATHTNLNCSQCGRLFSFSKKEAEILDIVAPVFSGKKYHIPIPKKCPDCRRIIRLAFRNERKMYKRNCDATGKSIISIYSPNKPYVVYDFDYWWSDAYDPYDFGMDYDPNRSFMQQYKELLEKTPKLAIHNSKSENSAYTNYAFSNKDCYLITGSAENQNCLYSSRIFTSTYCIDSFSLNNCQNCYECSDSVGLYGCIMTRNSENSHSLVLCDNCDNCNDCYGCVNLSGKQYHFFNQELSKDEYVQKVSSVLLAQSEKLFADFKKINPVVVNLMENCESCSGNLLLNCKNCISSYSIKESESVTHCFIGSHLNDVADCNYVDRNDRAYNGTNMNGNNHVMCANLVWGSKEAYYCSLTFNCENMFGCSCIKGASYCILNKQYTKEEYESLVPKIIEHMQKTGEWGEFFPASLSPFGYNETVANEYFPLTREGVLTPSLRGNEVTKQSSHLSGSPRSARDDESSTFLHGPIFNWSDYEVPFPKVEKIIPAPKLPDDITKIPDDILNWAVECEVTGKPFRIIKQELEFYRKHNLPIPRRHPDQRHKDRMNLRAGFNPKIEEK